jgi:hypothetical protein
VATNPLRPRSTAATRHTLLPRVIMSSVPSLCIVALRSGSLILSVPVLLALSTVSMPAQSPDNALLTGLASDFFRLAPQTIRPAEGYIRYPYLIPAGYHFAASTLSR